MDWIPPGLSEVWQLIWALGAGTQADLAEGRLAPRWSAGPQDLQHSGGGPAGKGIPYASCVVDDHTARRIVEGNTGPAGRSGGDVTWTEQGL